jgi:hypothetical protein
MRQAVRQSRTILAAASCHVRTMKGMAKAPKHKVDQVRKAAASPRRTGAEAASVAAELMHDPRKAVREVAASALSQRAKQ